MMITPEPQGAWDRSIDRRIAGAFRKLADEAARRDLDCTQDLCEAVANELEDPKPEPPEAPLGVDDVVRWSHESAESAVLCVFEGIGERFALVCAEGKTALVFRVLKLKRVKLAAIHAGDVVRDVEHGLCVVVKITSKGFQLSKCRDGCNLRYYRQRHHIALVARNQPEES